MSGDVYKASECDHTNKHEPMALALLCLMLEEVETDHTILIFQYYYVLINISHQYLVVVLEPLLGALSAMRATRPTARSAFACFEILFETLEVLDPGLVLLHDCQPTDPLISCEWGEVIPCCSELILIC